MCTLKSPPPLPLPPFFSPEKGVNHGPIFRINRSSNDKNGKLEAIFAPGGISSSDWAPRIAPRHASSSQKEGLANGKSGYIIMFKGFTRTQFLFCSWSMQLLLGLDLQ